MRKWVCDAQLLQCGHGVLLFQREHTLPIFYSSWVAVLRVRSLPSHTVSLLSQPLRWGAWEDLKDGVEDSLS